MTETRNCQDVWTEMHVNSQDFFMIWLNQPFLFNFMTINAMLCVTHHLYLRWKCWSLRIRVRLEAAAAKLP